MLWPGDLVSSQLSCLWAAEPEPQPSSGEAETRLETLSAQERIVWQIIQREMADATEEERAIYFEQFRELPPAAVSDVLRVRRQLQNSSPLKPQAFPAPIELSPGAPEVPRAARTSLPLSLAVEILKIHECNLQHVSTPGYRRMIPLTWPQPPKLTETASTVATPAEGVWWTAGAVAAEEGQHGPRPYAPQLVGIQLDLSPGPCLMTGRALDVMIRGQGWLAVRVDHEIQFTRYGRLVLADGWLSIAVGERSYPVHPSIKLGPVTQVTLDAQGAVHYRQQQSELTHPERLRLVQLTDCSSLEYSPQGFLRDRAGSAFELYEPGQSPVGQIVIGCLEGSNVKLEEEQRLRDYWRQVIPTSP